MHQHIYLINGMSLPLNLMAIIWEIYMLLSQDTNSRKLIDHLLPATL